MKKILFITGVILCMALQITAQMRDTSLNMNNHKAAQYFKKAKKQKTAGWLVLGGGLALCYASVANAFTEVDSPNGNYNLSDQPSSKITIEEFMAYGGAAAIFASIPLFIASGKNKRKANLILNDETIYFNLKSKKHHTSIGLKINL